MVYTYYILHIYFIFSHLKFLIFILVYKLSWQKDTTLLLFPPFYELLYSLIMFTRTSETKLSNINYPKTLIFIDIVLVFHR